MAKNFCNEFKHFIEKEWKAISYVFLGAGLMIFIMNISAMLSFLPKQYSYLNFDVSVFASILLIVYVVYSLHEKKHH